MVLQMFQTWGADFFSELDVAACIFFENVSIEIFNISFESTQNKHNNMAPNYLH